MIFFVEGTTLVALEKQGIHNHKNKLQKPGRTNFENQLFKHIFEIASKQPLIFYFYAIHLSYR